MTFDEAKELLERLGYETTAQNWESLLEKLHADLGPMAVGQRLHSMGELKHLYVGWMSGSGVGYLVQEIADLRQRLTVLNMKHPSVLTKAVRLPTEPRSFQLKTIRNAIGQEITHLGKLNRLPASLAKFPTTYDDETRTQHRSEDKIIEGLLAGDASALKVFRDLMVYTS